MGRRSTKKGRKGKKNRCASIRRKQRGGVKSDFGEVELAALPNVTMLFNEQSIQIVSTRSTVELSIVSIPITHDMIENLLEKNEEKDVLSGVTHVFLSYCIGKDEIFNNFIAILLKIKDLKSFSLRSVPNTVGSCVRTLIQYFPFMPNLTTLDLYNNGISNFTWGTLPTVWSELFDKLPSLKMLTSLNLSMNDMGDTGGKQLASVLPSMKNLVELNLENTNLSPDCIELLNNKKLSTLKIIT